MSRPPARKEKKKKRKVKQWLKWWLYKQWLTMAVLERVADTLSSLDT